MFHQQAENPADGRATSNPLDRRAGALIRQRRETLGMTQTDLASKCGVTFQQIQKYERGSNRVSYSRLVQIAAALNTPPAWFFEGLDTDGAGEFTNEQAGILESPEGRSILRAFPRMDQTMRRAVADLASALARQAPAVA
ncbi:helix-turn-helix domain-containing protein [Brevundimonas sp.]|uniref:helix-turn-helix domain-containing protein n=1 Tax=Brevundimonas sp. TaxID=1871086 RepID=UPI00286BDB8C|nr:helix-turn-helix domain-containing protein [Brevundimonas sp.]